MEIKVADLSKNMSLTEAVLTKHMSVYKQWRIRKTSI